MTDNKRSTETVRSAECAHSRAVATLTVTAFRWERQFLTCSDCGCTYTAQWRDTYVEPASAALQPVHA